MKHDIARMEDEGPIHPLVASGELTYPEIIHQEAEIIQGHLNGNNSVEKVEEALIEAREKIEPDQAEVGFVTKDSGQRRQFGTGAQRDVDTNKGRQDLMPGLALIALEDRLSVYEADEEYQRDELMGDLLRECCESLTGNTEAFYHCAILASFIIGLDEGEAKNIDDRLNRGIYNLTVIPLVAIRRYAQLLQRGAVKYEARNWEKGMPFSVFQASMIRHAWQASAGMTDEDHLAAVMFNALCVVHFLEIGRTDLNDLVNQ